MNDPSITLITDSRTTERYLVRWKMAVVFEDQDHRPTYRGRTYDLSLGGTGMLTSISLTAKSSVTVLLAPPPLTGRDRPKVIEIKARPLGTVYSGETQCFRLGFRFLDFKNDGFDYLQERLSHHMAVSKASLARPVR